MHAHTCNDTASVVHFKILYTLKIDYYLLFCIAFVVIVIPLTVVMLVLVAMMMAIIIFSVRKFQCALRNTLSIIIHDVNYNIILCKSLK